MDLIVTVLHGKYEARINKYNETCLHLQRKRKFLERLMIWTMLILFPQTSNLFIKKLCCTSLKTTKHWSRWSQRVEVLQWDMFPEPTDLFLIGCLDRINLDLRFPIKFFDPRPTRRHTNALIVSPLCTRWPSQTTLQTYYKRKFPHVMSRNHLLCLTLAITVLPIVLKWCRKERKKIQVKKESQQNQSRWRIVAIEIPCKGSDRACLYCMWKPGEHQIWKSESTSELVKCAANTYGETRNAGWLIKSAG